VSRASRKSLHYYRVIRERVEKRGLRNVRVINDAFLILQKMLADNSVSELPIYFPDPWPQKRQQKLRSSDLRRWPRCAACWPTADRAFYVTDHREYFEAAEPLIAQFFRIERRIPAPADPPRTNYEAKYRAQGREIFEIGFENN